MSGVRIAVVGATGLVGQTIMDVLRERQVPVDTLVALAHQSQGRMVQFGSTDIPVEPIEEMDWGRVDVAYFAAGNAVSERYAPRALEQGVTVIDKSSRYRMDPAVPLIVPEVNGQTLTDQKLIASPNCSTIQLVIALAPIHRRFGINRVIVSTYQAVSGSGRDAVDELASQIHGPQGPMSSPKVYPAPIAHNVLPYCDQFGEDNYTGEEWKLTRETAKILGSDVPVSATAVRVPVFVGHAESVFVTTKEGWTLDDVRQALKSQPSVRIVDNPGEGVVPTPLDASGQDQVLIGRIRKDLHDPWGLHLFVVADNLRRGAATNAIDIMDLLSHRWSAGVRRP